MDTWFNWIEYPRKCFLFSLSSYKFCISMYVKIFFPKWVKLLICNVCRSTNFLYLNGRNNPSKIEYFDKSTSVTQIQVNSFTLIRGKLTRLHHTFNFKLNSQFRFIGFRIYCIVLLQQILLNLLHLIWCSESHTVFSQFNFLLKLR